MVDLWEKESLTVDTAGVLFKLVGSMDTASNWTILVDFSLHLCFSRETMIIADIVFLKVNSFA